ncbi:hypothetical protein QVD17_02595 [Tagetes erecta]|uniref:non-specific serine/threonine protein kinase n=1 Tax=Tagetes erecta TaxID=13708 RepID=A0AAD8LD26_TARER|nr:hypothetical protein QVD17_02595 [Tagetes erecta]
MFPASTECEPSTSSSSSIQWSQPFRHIEFPEILSATYDFDESLVIGKGGFGKVYRGNILIGDTLVVAAIKRLDPESSQGPDEFWAEVETLSLVRHHNIVPLIGYCIHEQEKILVYEYMSNGTLDDHLHKGGITLSWLQRLKICVGAAHGLRYLHNDVGVDSGIIHRDFKSSNILLHETWTAKITDFGLSKTCPTNQPSTHVSTIVKGTYGYFDPSYYQTGKLTRKSDVYAFGVVLLEVLCRRRAVEKLPDEEWRSLATWAQDSIKEGNLKQIIDSDIRGEISPKCLKEFVRITERCLQENPEKRPTMAGVVVTLESVLALQEKFNKSLQPTGTRTIFGRMVDMLPFSSNGENYVEGDSNLSHSSPSVKEFKFDDLKQATENFSSVLMLDKYGSGKLFLGWVQKNTLAPSIQGAGIAIAVKWSNQESSKERAEWLAQVNILGQLVHPNIVRLLGCCKDIHRQFLVYERMPTEDFDCFSYSGGKPLSTRLSIMIRILRGMTYLHSRNINTRGLIDCILIDEDFNVKLWDFGLKKYRFGTRESLGSKRNSGTLDDAAQKHIITGEHLSMKTDIYDFGCLLLESISPRSAWRWDGRPKTHQEFMAGVRSSDRINVKDIVDSHPQDNYPLQSASDCVALAIRCTATAPKDRPSSKKVLERLEQIYDQSLQITSTLLNNSNGNNMFPEMKEVQADSQSPRPNLKVFKFSDLEKATRNFRLDLLLGEGGFGKVFLGWVEQKTLAPSKQGVGIAVAVKRLSQESMQGHDEWLAEVKYLGQLIHPNIIRLLGYCKDESERLLVYEHMPNNSFDRFLFTGTTEQLSWERRLLIMIGVARGLTYLHSRNVIRYDSKASDILLDKDFNAKLGDFGLVRYGPDTGDTHVSTRVMGTYGYAAPEYIATGHLTMKCDIYGFGVTLMESITGRKTLDLNRPKEEQNLVEWASRIESNRRNLIKKIMDPHLENYPVEGASKCFALALRCVAKSPKDRPSSEEVLQSLEQIYALNQ